MASCATLKAMYGAVDIGGTKTLVAVFDLDGNIVERIKFPTPKNYSEFVKELAANVAKLSTKEFSFGAVGIRGNINRETGMSLRDDVLPWGGVPIRDDCRSVFNCPFVLENDSKLAGLSEALLVKNRYHKVLYVTISTGIGSAFIVNGVLDADTQDSEIGKSVYEHDGEVRQLEDFASGKAIVEKYGKLAEELDDQAAWTEITHNLAIGLVNAVAAFTPEIVILGGGVGSHFKKFEKPLIEAMHKVKPDEIAMPVVKQAERPEEAVVYGCYELAKAEHAKVAAKA